MINPTKFPRYDLNDTELEEVALFCIAVAGKNARVTAMALERFLRDHGWDGVRSPFDLIRSFATPILLGMSLKAAGIGCHQNKAKAMYGLVHSELNLRTCSVEDLEAVFGIGPKTARFFILHTRPDAVVACLDVHILKYLGTLGYTVPRQTPSGKRYLELERAYLEQAKKLGKTPAALDIEVWKAYSRN